MPGLNRRLDPATGDYIRDGKGGHEKTGTIETGVYHQIRGKRSHWIGDIDAGSDLYLVPRRNLDRGALTFTEGAIVRALQPFVDAGQATDVSVALHAEKGGRIVIDDASITDTQAGDVDFSDIPGIGIG